MNYGQFQSNLNWGIPGKAFDKFDFCGILFATLTIFTPKRKIIDKKSSILVNFSDFFSDISGDDSTCLKMRFDQILP